MKRLLAIFAVLLLAVSVSACSPQPTTLQSRVTDDSPAAVTVYAYEPDNEPTYGLLYLGHAFLSFENRSQQPFAIGAITLAPGESCSLGTWSMSHHFGIWYNIESKYIDAAGKYGGRVSLTKEMPLACLDAVNAYIAAHDKWSLTNNSARFASDIFNLVDGDRIDLSGLATPTRLAKTIHAFDAHEIDRPIENYGKVGFIDKTGGFAEYEYAK